MKTYVSVECNRCRTEIKQTEAVYCSGCMDDKIEELHKQDEQIKDLNVKIEELKHIIDWAEKRIQYYKNKEKN